MWMLVCLFERHTTFTQEQILDMTSPELAVLTSELFADFARRPAADVLAASAEVDAIIKRLSGQKG